MRIPDIIKKAVAGISAAVLMMSFSSCSKSEIHEVKVEHKTEVPPKMMFLGDSIAAGYGLDGYKKGDNYNCPSYSNILKNKYTSELEGECGHAMVNEAVSGYTSSDLITQIQSGELDSELKDADAVVVSIGGNDLLGILFKLIDSLGIEDINNFDVKDIDFAGAAVALLGMGSEADKALEQFTVNIDIISSELKSRTDGTVFVQTLYDPVEYFDRLSVITEFTAQNIEKLNNIISEKSANGYKVIDVAPRFKGRADELTNIKKMDIHPNAAGHEIIAEEVDKAFRATGFSYVTTEKVEQKSTDVAKTALLWSSVGIALLVIIFGVIFALRKKSKK